MTFASIMVHVDSDKHTQERIGAAADLAARFNALLIGIAGWPLRRSSILEHSSTEDPAFEQARLAKIQHQLDALGESFRHVAGANPGGVEWRSSHHIPNEVVATQARAADLVIIGRDPLPGDVYHTFDPGVIILACGRPVLVLPQGVDRAHGQRVLIAWKDTSEARRAVHSAMPLLRQAQRVSIAAVGPANLREIAHEQIGDVARYLERHRVAPGRQIVESSAEADGKLLLRIAEEQKSDLIVAGAYGRSRLSEWIFGGVTRDLLTGSKVPCLFAN